jgi:hypothetical protein
MVISKLFIQVAAESRLGKIKWLWSWTLSNIQNYILQ